jgi:hypothetical protein
MASLRNQFESFYAPSEDDIAAAIKTGLVTPDTNVLLALYRFQAEARDELFGVLDKLGERLWIPHQVGLEFQRNRLNVIHEQEEFFSKTEQEFSATFDGLREKVRAFRTRMAITEAQIGQVEDTIQDLQGLLGTVMNWASDGSLSMSDHTSDPVRAQLEVLLGDRVGEPMEPRELEEARKEAERRVREKIPPGYKDKDKSDPTGDYLVWRQLMNEAKERKLPVVFITDDRKEDWYRREHGLTLGARYELREEMRAEAGVPFVIMTTGTFLLHAKNYLDAEVSPETVDQAKELPVLYAPHHGKGEYQPPEWLVPLDFKPGTPMSTSIAQLALGTFVLWQAMRRERKKPEQDRAELAEFTAVLGALDTSAEPQKKEQEEDEQALLGE